MTDTLIDLQSVFQNYILRRDERALARIESTPAMPAGRRLDIYYDGFRLRLIEVLADTYERVAQYIGEESFDTAARAYIERHTPKTRNVRDYGTAFPEFLAAYFADDPEVAELARMDMRLRYTFDAADAPALSVADVATIRPGDWDRAAFTLHPSASLQTFRWNTPVLWQHLSADEAPPSAAPLPEPAPWLFWRKELQPHFRSLSAEEHSALRAIAAGQSFGAVCTQLADTCPQSDVTTRLAAWLRTWLDDGVLSRFNLSAATP
jgi:hypothetical protein